jgi:hypothetical protein
MHWLAPNQDGTITLENLQLDIVGFLAILGEGSVLANAQVSTLSKWIFLPRLIPAPQALMRPTRPLVLEPVPGNVAGIFSGNYRDNINHIGNIVWYVALAYLVASPGPFPTSTKLEHISSETKRQPSNSS